MPNRTKTWVVVADGKRAKILEKSGESLTKIGATHHNDEISVEKDKGVARPGFSKRFDAIKAFTPHIEWHEFPKQAFAKEIAGLLNEAYEEFDKLIVIAPPETLGEMRQHFDSHVNSKITHEVDKDLTKHPLEEIKRYLIPD